MSVGEEPDTWRFAKKIIHCFVELLFSGYFYIMYQVYSILLLSFLAGVTADWLLERNRVHGALQNSIHCFCRAFKKMDRLWLFFLAGVTADWLVLEEPGTWRVANAAFFSPHSRV